MCVDLLSTVLVKQENDRSDCKEMKWHVNNTATWQGLGENEGLCVGTEEQQQAWGLPSWGGFLAKEHQNSIYSKAV